VGFSAHHAHEHLPESLFPHVLAIERRLTRYAPSLSFGQPCMRHAWGDLLNGIDDRLAWYLPKFLKGQLLRHFGWIRDEVS
jgi:hypothetical protein